MKRFKVLFIFLIVSSFLFITNIKADYKAIVVNPEGAKCPLKRNSTGYCVYKDANLNSYVNTIVWFDTGDEVTVIENKPTVPTNNVNLCSDYYQYISFYYHST